jgi:hypothetical protein
LQETAEQNQRDIASYVLLSKPKNVYRKQLMGVMLEIVMDPHGWSGKKEMDPHGKKTKD